MPTDSTTTHRPFRGCPAATIRRGLVRLVTCLVLYTVATPSTGQTPSWQFDGTAETGLRNGAVLDAGA
ncbi:MAG: hypothetical protein AAGE94_21805, partial [Acidobacteriota bacterium]